MENFWLNIFSSLLFVPFWTPVTCRLATAQGDCFFTPFFCVWFWMVPIVRSYWSQPFFCESDLSLTSNSCFSDLDTVVFSFAWAWSVIFVLLIDVVQSVSSASVKVRKAVMRANMCACVHMCACQRLVPDVFHNCSHPCFSVSLELTGSARLTDQRAPGAPDPALGLHAYSITPGFLMWILGVRFRLMCLCS